MTDGAVIAADVVADGGSEQAGPGWIEVRDGRIVGRGAGRPDAATHRAELVIPGGVDMHVHGALGIDFATPGVDPDPAIRHHHAAGATSILASIATGTIADTVRRLRELSEVVRRGDLAGIHLEGPWLSARRRGAHAEALLHAPTPGEVDAVLEAGDGSIRMVTLAPELSGALAATRALVAAGVVVAVGHTDADAVTVARAVEAGATVVTHLFNGMPPLEHRRPGVVGAALGGDELIVELIADGVHVDDLVVATVMRAAAERVALVSDAMAATGWDDGEYDLAGSPVVVRNGVARLADDSSLAGSTTPLGDVVSRLRAQGYPPTVLAAAATGTPARALGLPVPTLQIGERADLLVFSGSRRQAMRSGRWLTS